MSNLRSLSARQKKATREMPSPMFNKNVPQIKQLAVPQNNIKKQLEKPKMTIGDAIGLITIRLGKVEQQLIGLDLNSTPTVIDQNQNMNTTEEQLLLLNTSLERIQKLENSTKNIDRVDSDLRDAKDLLIKIMSKQEKNVADQDLQNSKIYTFINNKIDEIVEKKVNDLLHKTADEIVSKNVDDIINIKYNDIASNILTVGDHETVNVSVGLSE
jgi:hypothetical protein